MGFHARFVPIIAILMLAGCGDQRITVESTLPALKVDLAGQGVKRIAIGDLIETEQAHRAGGGAAVGDDLRAGLVDLNRFEVLDRTAVAALLKEQGLNASGLVDSTQAAATGKFSGATALVLGRVSTYGFNEQMQTQSSKQGMAYRRLSTVVVEASFRIVDIASGRLVASVPCRVEIHISSPKDSRNIANVLDPTPVPQYQLGGQPPPIDSGAALAEARKQAVALFVNSIAPHHISFVTTIQEDSDVPEIGEGVKDARIGEWASATGHFRKATAAAPSSPSAFYDLGIALRATGDFEGAITSFKQAYRLKDDALYRNALEQTKQFAAGAAQQ
jgi:curli biogenesis system outer membrane secretion channel CsgG